jgi:iron complex outermembrane receptor protein
LPTFVYQQTNAQLLGAETSIELQLADPVSSGISFSIVRGTDTESEEPIFLMPPDRVRAHLQLGGLNFGGLQECWGRAEVFAVAKQRDTVPGLDFAEAPDRYVLLSLSAGAQIPFGGRDLTMVLELDNALNARYRDYLSLYRYYADEPGRDLWLRLQLPLGKE